MFGHWLGSRCEQLLTVTEVKPTSHGATLTAAKSACVTTLTFMVSTFDTYYIVSTLPLAQWRRSVENIGESESMDWDWEGTKGVNPSRHGSPTVVAPESLWLKCRILVRFT